MKLLLATLAVLAWLCGFSAAASSPRALKMINDFLAHRVDDVAKAIKLDLRLEFITKGLYPSPTRAWVKREIKQIVDHPRFVVSATSELNTYVHNLTITKGMFWRLRDPNGNVHHMLGTVHNFHLQNFDDGVFDELEQIIDGSDLLLGELTGDAFVRAAKLHNRIELGEHVPALQELDNLDDQISLLALLKGKNVSELETNKDIEMGLQKFGLHTDDFADTTDELIDRLIVELDAKQGSIHEKTAIANTIVDMIADQHLQAKYLKLSYSKADTRSLTDTLLKDLDRIDDLLLGYRNKLWTERIATACNANNRCFIYAGVGHMLIDSGNIRSLISILREQGYEIEELF